MNLRSICTPETLKLLEVNIGKTLEDIDKGNSFLNRTPIAQEEQELTNGITSPNIKYQMDKQFN
jgi:hypothetical protein